MISSVCQGLQSHVESHVLSFQLFPQEPSFSSRFSGNVHKQGEVEENSTIGIARNRDEDYNVRRSRANAENGEGWSFLEALSNGNGSHDKGKEDNVYVHPLVKRSSSKLSKKSLEMCTESLGSESGSDMGENDISLVTLDSGSNDRGSTWVPKKANRRDSTFPPPLTSISGSTGVRVESYREDGRLVLRAVATSACRSSYFHAERSQGRLKLQLVRNIEKRAEEVGEGEEVFGDQVFSSEVEEEAYWDNDRRQRWKRWGRCGNGKFWKTMQVQRRQAREQRVAQLGATLGFYVIEEDILIKTSNYDLSKMITHFSF